MPEYPDNRPKLGHLAPWDVPPATATHGTKQGIAQSIPAIRGTRKPFRTEPVVTMPEPVIVPEPWDAVPDQADTEI